MHEKRAVISHAQAARIIAAAKRVPGDWGPPQWVNYPHPFAQMERLIQTRFCGRLEVTKEQILENPAYDQIVRIDRKESGSENIKRCSVYFVRRSEAMALANA